MEMVFLKFVYEVIETSLKLLLFEIMKKYNVLKIEYPCLKKEHGTEDDLCQHCMGSGEKVIVHFVSHTAYCPFSCRMKYENISKQILDLF